MFTSNSDAIVVKTSDYQRLLRCIQHQDSELADALESELARADVVADTHYPANAVAMGSQVIYRDLETQTETTVTLVYPEEAQLEQMRVSVLSPIGVALLGLKVGESIDWTQPTGKIRQLGIVDVHQPETSDEA